MLELGAELISSDIIAFYELIKNGFDAGSKRGVDVSFDIVLPRHAYMRLKAKIAVGGELDKFKEAVIDAFLPGATVEGRNGYEALVSAARTLDDLSEALDLGQSQFNVIRVLDRGTGMSEADLRNAFLVIGTPSRKKEVEAALARGATETPYLGEKGIGRLSAMRLGERLRVETARTDDALLNILEIDWNAFSDVDAMLDEIPVAPTIGGPKLNPAWSGTCIVVSDLLEQWTAERVRDMCSYDFARLTDPLLDVEERPRISVTFNGERMAIPFMPQRLLRAAHARVTGRYEIHEAGPTLTCTVEVVDLGFDHPLEAETVVLGPEDLEAAIVGKDGELEDTALTSVGPFTFEAHWFNRRRLSRVDTTGENKALRDLQTQWSGILLYRDSFRVFPYGEEEDDWL